MWSVNLRLWRQLLMGVAAAAHALSRPLVGMARNGLRSQAEDPLRLHVVAKWVARSGDSARSASMRTLEHLGLA